MCEAGDGTRVTIAARYCVGADGASSPVREATGIPFTGVTNEHTFYVADAEAVQGLVADAINLRFGDTQFLLAFPMAGAGHHRLIGVVRAEPDEEVAEEPVRGTLAEVFGVTYDSASWFSTYRVHHRVAASFRARGRLPRRRRGARALPRRRAGDEHGPAGRAQPGVQAGGCHRPRRARLIPRPLWRRADAGGAPPRRHDRYRLRHRHVGSPGPAPAPPLGAPGGRADRGRRRPRLPGRRGSSSTSRRRASTTG